VSSEEIDIEKDCRILINFKEDCPYNHPELEDQEIIFTSIDNNIEDSFVLVLLLKIV
jgi:hypothetical protein